MNEELKPTALSSGDYSGVTTSDDLKDFLIRRQLLEMESKRIEEVLAEAEAELKNRQERLIGVRHGASTSLRVHLDQMEELARANQQARVGGLKALPKAVERYVRRGVKQLLGSRKPVSGETTAGWHLPEVRTLNAWRRWFAENDPARHRPSLFRKDRIQVALVVSGGTGDLLESTHLVGAVSDHFCCDVSIIAAQSNVEEIVAHNPYVIDALVPVTGDVFGLAECLRDIPVFDLIIVWRYGVHYIVPPGSRIAQADIRDIEARSSDLGRILEKYYLSQGWPTFFFALSREMAQVGLSALEISVATCGLSYRHLYEIPFFPSKQSLRIVSALLPKSYVTVHHGFDTKLLPARTRKTDYSSTKNLSMQQWRKIVLLLRKEGVEVVQLGVVEEQKIEGVTNCLNGQTSFEETALLIKHSLCHIDTEGGLVHLAHAVHGRCVVLFGPTPTEFFGYPENINLQPTGCKACWFATKTWLIECPRHTSGPECMAGHSPSSVADAVKRIVAESASLSAKVIAAEARSSPTWFRETIASAQAVVSRNTANNVLFIFDDLPASIGTEWAHSIPDGADVIICAGGPSRWGSNDRAVGRFEYGSLINLPRASSSIDAAVWVSCEVESDIAPFALREIFRVLKPGGELVFAAVGESTGLDLRHSLAAARIGFDEDEMPLAPVYSFSLRRNDGPQAGGLPPSVRGPETIQARGHAVDPRLALIEQKNARQISLVRDTIVERQKVINQEYAVVDLAIQRGFGGDGWIWVSESFADGYPGKFFLKGWGNPQDWAIFSRDDKCILMLLHPEESYSGHRRIELQLHLAVPKATASNPTTIGIRVDDGAIENFRVSTDDVILTVQISTQSSKYRGVSLVEFLVGDAFIYGASDRSLGKMAMGVKRFRSRLLIS